jgi:hypothetical protein
MSNSFSLPIDVPWYLIAASPDMMATSFCNQPADDASAYPPVWHSSLAIYAYEPSPDDLPTELCNQKITYLKVTCSITGFQPTAEESNVLAQSPYSFASPYPSPSQSGTEPFELAFPNTEGSDIDYANDFGDFEDQYFACYGVLLNVKVVPSVTTVAQTTPGSPNTITFAQTGSLSNPFLAAPDGTTFTLSTSGSQPPSIHLGAVPGARARGIELNSGDTLEIDLPLSTNISIAIYARGHKRTVGTVTAYDFTTQTYSGPLATSAAGGPTQVQIPCSSATRLVVGVSTSDVSFVSVTYSSLERPTTLADYPHIIDFEPKTRDLYQSATDQSELLTGSSGSINTGKSLTNTSSSQMGLGLSTNVSGSYYGTTFGGSASMTGSWGNTSSDQTTTQVDASRETRETQGSTTNITQQYNLLTGYHAGTNRAAFLMLPRPHTLQPTDYRTFVRGLRMIEGVQEFFLIVSRPLELPGICIEATLETGHFPETVSTSTPPAPALTTVQIVPAAPVNAPPGIGVGTSPAPTSYTCTLTSPWTLDTSQLTSPNTPTPSDADPNVPWRFLAPGLFYTYGPLSGQTTSSSPYKQATGSFSIGVDTTTSTGVTGTIWVTPGGDGSWGNLGGTNAAIQVWVAMCGTQPAPGAAPPIPVVVSPFLVTSRDLCVCINSCSTDNCVMIAPTEQVPYGQSPGPVVNGGSSASTSGADATTGAPSAGGAPAELTAARAAASAAPKKARARGTAIPGAAPGAPAMPPGQGAGPTTKRRSVTATQPVLHGPPGRSSVVYESKVRIPSELLKPEQLKKSRTPAAREVMFQIQHHMLNNWRLPQRRPPHTVGYLDSDFVAQRLMKHLSRRYLAHPVTDVKNLPPAAVRNLGRKTTVGTVLAMELHRLRKLAKVSLEEAIAIRRTLLGLSDLARGTGRSAETSGPGDARRRPVPSAPAEPALRSDRRQNARRKGKRRA